MAGALLGAVQIKAMLTKTTATDPDEPMAAHRQRSATAGMADDVEKLAGFLRWQVPRVAGLLKLVGQDPSTGPIPLVAAHTAEGLQKLLGVICGGRLPDVEVAREHIAEMKAARQCLVGAIGNVDILLGMLSGLTDLIGPLDREWTSHRWPRSRRLCSPDPSAWPLTRALPLSRLTLSASRVGVGYTARGVARQACEGEC
ncbi:DUF6245 family protein [Streptosporangium sandarakinum]|uniref:DUF6245 family protein n=1 Tax=Streptosporangium nondiastaticum TaxID=35764 RepID=UPI0031F82A14